MSDTPRHRTLRDFLAILRANRGVIVVLTLVVGAGSYLLWSSQTKTYEATATIACADPLADARIVGLRPARRSAPADQAKQCARSTRDDAVVRRLVRTFERRPDALPFVGPTAALPDRRSGLVRIISTSSRPEVAALVANEMAAEVVVAQRREAREEIGTAIASLRRSNRGIAGRFPAREALSRSQLFRLRTLRALADPVQIVEAATPASEPIAPDVLGNTLLGCCSASASGCSWQSSARA